MSEVIKQINVETGTHALGNNTTLNAISGTSTLEFHDKGVIYHHSKAKKRILVPFNNIKAIVLDFNVQEVKAVEKSVGKVVEKK